MHRSSRPPRLLAGAALVLAACSSSPTSARQSFPLKTSGFNASSSRIPMTTNMVTVNGRLKNIA